MPTVGDLRKAVTTDKIIGQTLDKQPALNIEKSNPYYKFAQSQQMHSISKLTPKVKEELTLKPIPPNYERVRPITPKAYKYLSKTAGKRKRNKKKQTKKNRKYSKRR